MISTQKLRHLPRFLHFSISNWISDQPGLPCDCTSNDTDKDSRNSNNRHQLDHADFSQAPESRLRKRLPSFVLDRPNPHNIQPSISLFSLRPGIYIAILLHPKTSSITLWGDNGDDKMASPFRRTMPLDID